MKDDSLGDGVDTAYSVDKVDTGANGLIKLKAILLITNLPELPEATIEKPGGIGLHY